VSDVLKTNELIVAKLRKAAKQAEWYQALDTKLLTAAADALEAATREQDSAGDIRRAVRLWSDRFIPGDRWDTEDARDLDAALNCVVEANPDRSHARVPVQGEPNDDRTPEFEAIEQELFKHQPLLSMQDGSIRGCKCMDRVFVTKTEDWGTHLAEVFMRLPRATVPDAATDVREYLHAKCDCVPDLGPAHCHLCSADGSPVEWANCVAVQQVTDAPETVEAAFKTVEVERLGHLLVQLSPATPRNGAATVRRLMEEMNIKEVVS